MPAAHNYQCVGQHTAKRIFPRYQLEFGRAPALHGFPALDREATWFAAHHLGLAKARLLERCYHFAANPPNETRKALAQGPAYLFSSRKARSKGLTTRVPPTVEKINHQ